MPGRVSWAAILAALLSLLALTAGILGSYYQDYHLYALGIILSINGLVFATLALRE